MLETAPVLVADGEGNADAGRLEISGGGESVKERGSRVKKEMGRSVSGRRR